MRFLFLAYIGLAALFAGATVWRDRTQLAELEAEAKAQQESEARQAAAADAARRQALAAQQTEAKRQAQEAQARAAQQQALERKQAIELRCDQLAANSFDRFRNQAVPGVPYDMLRLNVAPAVTSCRAAITESPDTPRFRYQLARAFQAGGNPGAEALLVGLTQEGYPAAFDNLGWLLHNKKDYRTAATYFRAGVTHGDPESMVSLAGYLLEGRYVPKDEREAMRLLEEAEKYGHPAAIQAMEKYREQQRMSAAGLALFGAVLGQVLQRGR